MQKNNLLVSNFKIALILLLGIIMWNIAPPEGLDTTSWHLFIIFVSTIIGIILNPLPIGAITTIGALFLVLTKTLTLKQTLSGFSDEIVWLIVFAFFISGGFINTGLGARIAYSLIAKFGHSTLGLAYSLVFTDLALSPSIPSVTARGGGILFPIASSLSKVFSNNGKNAASSSRNGGFFMAICMQSNVITSAMFLTAMAANPVIVKLALMSNIDISWFDWALAALVPGMISLILMPLFMYYYLYPPSIRTSTEAPKMAQKKLIEMGTISNKELVMIGIFFILIFSWIFGKKLFGINASGTALLGYVLLLITRLITFEETVKTAPAWNTFIWFGHLGMMSSFLAKMGIMSWIELYLKTAFIGYSPLLLILCLSLIYFYMHYLFASATAHVTVFFPTFLLLFTNVGIDGKIAALILGFLSILSSGLTHFGLASAPIFFGAGYIGIKTWFRIGLLSSILYLIIWAIAGSGWWKVIGLW